MTRGRSASQVGWVAAALVLHAAPALAIRELPPVRAVPVPVELRATLAAPPAKEEVIAPEPEPTPKRPALRRQRRAKPRRSKPRPEAPTPPPEPTPEGPPPEAAPPLMAVGLSLGATSKGGKGPAFAVGQSLNGATPTVAHEPEPSGIEPERTPSVRRRRRENPSGPGLELPRRLARVEPVYPPSLLASGLEATVVVELSLEADGRVSEVRLLRRARQPAFNEAARAAAAKERFAPARLRGRAVRYTLSFSYHFRAQS